MFSPTPATPIPTSSLTLFPTSLPLPINRHRTRLPRSPTTPKQHSQVAPLPHGAPKSLLNAYVTSQALNPLTPPKPRPHLLRFHTLSVAFIRSKTPFPAKGMLSRGCLQGGAFKGIPSPPLFFRKHCSIKTLFFSFSLKNASLCETRHKP